MARRFSHGRRPAQRDQRLCAGDDRGDATIVPGMQRAAVAQFGIGGFDLLERGDAGEDPAVEFGQHHVNREVGRRQAAVGPGPGLAIGGRQRHLQHRRIDHVERRALAAIALRRERRGVDDHIGRDPCKLLAQPAVALGILQAGREQADRPQAAAREFGHHAVDRIGVGRGKNGAIEHHQHDWRAVRSQVDLVRFDYARIWRIEAITRQCRARDRRRRGKPGGERELRQRRAGRVRSAIVA